MTNIDIPNSLVELKVLQSQIEHTKIIAGDGSDHADVAANTAASHAEAHSVASHNDTTGTGAELNTLTDNSMADTLHRHSELSASDGTPDQALSVDATGNVGIGTSPAGKLHVNTAAARFTDNDYGTLLVKSTGIGRPAVKVQSVGNGNDTAFIIQGKGGDADDHGWLLGQNTGGAGVIGNLQIMYRNAASGGFSNMMIIQPNGNVSITGAVSSATDTITGTTANLDVSGINTLFVNPGAATTITGFTNGVAGQVLFVSAVANGQDITLIHNSGTQKVFLHTGASETLSHEYGGWTLVCDGTNWYDTEH